MLQSIRSKKETISSADATISLNIFFLMAVQLLIMILQNYCLENNSDLQLWSQICTGFIIFNLLLQTITFYYLRRIISLGYFFILCSYLVGCSFCVLIAFNLQQFDSAFFIVHLPDHGVNAFIEATRYSLNCICSLFVGYLIVSLVKFHSPESKSATKSNKYFETCKLIGIIFSIVFGLIYIVTTSTIYSFPKIKDKETLAKIYSAADVFLHPGVEETYGLTVAEACACGTATIVSKNSACEEAASDYSQLAYSIDMKYLVPTIIQLKENKGSFTLRK